MKAYIEVTSLHVWCLDIVDLALYAAACRERHVFYKRPRYVGTGIICAYIYIMYVCNVCTCKSEIYGNLYAIYKVNLLHHTPL